MPRAPAPSDRRSGGRAWDVLLLVLIVATAFGLRLVYVLQLRASPYFAHYEMDPGCHDAWARALVAGEPFWDGPYFRAPLYPWLLGLVYRIFGPDNPLAPRIVQAAIGSLSCGLLFLIGRQLFSRTVGALAGFAAAAYWILLYYDAELLIPVLIVFLDLLLLWLLLLTGARSSPVRWILCGLVLGLSAIARPNILLFAPALVAWIFVLHRPRWRRALGYGLCLFVGTIAPIAPVTVRNYMTGGEFVLIATQGGVNFYIGNNPHSDGMSAVIKGDPGEWRACYQAQTARVRQALGRPPRASEVSQWYFRQALRFMWQQPGKAAWLMLRKLGYFWSHWEVSNNQDIRFITSTYTPIVRYLPLGFWIVGPLGALGLILSLGRAKELFPLWGFVLIYMVSVVLFFVTARFRVPVVAVLILLGSYAAEWIVRALRARRWRALAGAALVLALMGVLAAQTPPKVDKAMIQEHRETGHELAKIGRLEEAERILSEYVRRAGTAGLEVGAESWYTLGYVRLKQGKYAGAVECFSQALEERPFYPDARSNLAVALAALGRTDEAVVQLRRVVRDDPANGGAHANLGNALAQLGQVEEAAAQFRLAIALNPALERNLLETAEVLRRRGKFSDAQRLLDSVRNATSRPRRP